MPVNITNRQDAEALIREQVVSTIFQDAPKQSVFMGMARKLPNMTSKQTRIRVLDFLPTAYWVNGDTGMKQTTRQAWDNVYLTAGELAVIVSMRRSDSVSIPLPSSDITVRLNGSLISSHWLARQETMSLIQETRICMTSCWVKAVYSPR